jgi:serine phosphatase RsbU (regulator of sigma subunit)/anti-sigma regulatory factor (Ser/Thr protein kinase)/anti-anti-sigma regulatory factor
VDATELQEVLVASLDQLPLLIAVTEGADQRLVMTSAAVREAMGDRPLGEPIASWTELLGQQLIERYDEVWRTGRPYAAKGWRLELVGPDGEPFELIADFTLTPVRDVDGAVRAIISCGHDVTEVVREQQGSAARAGAGRRRADAAEVVVSVQDAMLPTGLPVLPGAELAARYLLAEDEAGAGGDWFDAIPLPDGRLAVVVGDVVGHGVEASVAMGELKTVFDEALRRTGDALLALEALEARARRVPEARAATVCVCVVDHVAGELSYCTAGHPPPVVITAAGEAAYLPLSGAGPLGSGLPFRTARHPLGVGDVLLLYSDGLVERPGRTQVQNTVELLQVASSAFRGAGPVSSTAAEPVVERVCRQTLELLTRISGYSDDITLLALQVVAPVEPLVLRLPALPDAVRTARADLDQWLDRLWVGVVDSTAMRHAIGELVGNAVDHAYGSVDVRNPVTVMASLDSDGILELSVGDHGSWHEPESSEEPSEHGHGLAMVRGFVDDLHLEHDASGTTARVRHRLSHPAEMLRGRSTGAGGGGATDDGLVLTVADATVTLSGSVDREGATLLERALLSSSRGGARPVVVDLSAVTLLTSAGVRVLADARSAGEVLLLAPNGSPAQHVLDLVQLPYEG